jgi:hypothetical protein
MVKDDSILPNFWLFRWENSYLCKQGISSISYVKHKNKSQLKDLNNILLCDWLILTYQPSH